MSNQNSDHGVSHHNSASLAHAHVSRNLSPSLFSENFSKNSLISFVDPQISLYFGSTVSPEMLAQMQEGNAIASEHLGVAKQQLATSVALVQIELMKLESQLRADASQLRQEVVANYDRVFASQGKDAADRLFVHSPMHALTLIGMKLKSLYKTRDLPIDLSVDIAIIMLHASAQEQEALVQSFADEYFLGFNASGSFHDALNNLFEKIEQRVAEAEAKRLAEEEAKRLADAEAEAKRLAEDQAYHASSTLIPQKRLDDQEWKNSFNDSGNLLGGTLGELRAKLSTLMYHMQQGNVRKDYYLEKGLFGHKYYLDQIAGVKVWLYQFNSSDSFLFYFFFSRKILQEARIEFATAEGGVMDAFLRLYPRYNRNVRHTPSTLSSMSNYYVVQSRVYAAYALHHGTLDMFPSLSRAKLDKLRAEDMSGVYNFDDGYVAHCYLMATEPDYVEFMKAMRPYYIPDYAKR